MMSSLRVTKQGRRTWVYTTSKLLLQKSTLIYFLSTTELQMQNIFYNIRNRVSSLTVAVISNGHYSQTSWLTYQEAVIFVLS